LSAVRYDAIRKQINITTMDITCVVHIGAIGKLIIQIRSIVQCGAR